MSVWKSYTTTTSLCFPCRQTLDVCDGALQNTNEGGWQVKVSDLRCWDRAQTKEWQGQVYSRDFDLWPGLLSATQARKGLVCSFVISFLEGWGVRTKKILLHHCLTSIFYTCLLQLKGQVTSYTDTTQPVSSQAWTNENKHLKKIKWTLVFPWTQWGLGLSISLRSS